MPSIKKARTAADCQMLEQIPNIGPALAEDLRRIGVPHPAQLRNRNAFALYLSLCLHTGQRHDPCVLDAFLAACDFMHGAPAKPWWHYTALRKTRYGLALRNVFATPTPPSSPPHHAEESAAPWVWPSGPRRATVNARGLWGRRAGPIAPYVISTGPSDAGSRLMTYRIH